MRKILLTLTSILLMSGCTVIKTPSISQTDKDSGKIQTSYIYDWPATPTVKTDITLNSVNSQCKSWGYQDAKHTAGPEKDCISKDVNGNIHSSGCIKWQVSDLYECKLTTEQQAAITDKRQKLIKIQYEEKQRAIEEEKKEQEEVAKKYPYTAIIRCKSKYSNGSFSTRLCFVPGSIFEKGTTIELVSNKTYTFNDINDKYIDNKKVPFSIQLEKYYSLFARNSNEDFILNIEIKNTVTGEIIEQKNAFFGQIIHLGL